MSFKLSASMSDAIILKLNLTNLITGHLFRLLACEAIYILTMSPRISNLISLISTTSSPQAICFYADLYSSPQPPSPQAALCRISVTRTRTCYGSLVSLCAAHSLWGPCSVTLGGFPVSLRFHTYPRKYLR